MIVGKRWSLILALFLLELVIIVLVSNSAFLPSELTTYEKQYNSTAAVLNQTATAQGAAIFANNLRVAMYELTPLVGLAVFGLSLYETARIVQVIGMLHGEGVGLALGTLFFLPSTWLELPAYAIAAAESFYLVYAVVRGFRSGWGRLVREVRYLIASVILIACVLVVAATFEVAEIQIEQGPPQTQLFVFLTWLPFALLFAGGLAYWRRARKEAPLIEEREAAEMAPMAEAPQNVPEPGQPPARGEKDAAGAGQTGSSPK